MEDAMASDTDPHDEIERIEAQIEDIRSRLENCRKFILVARIALIGGAILLAVILLGAIAFDQRLLLIAIAAMLGGIVVWGSNHSTANEAADELVKAQAYRGALIEHLQLRVVSERPTLH
jgi:hypothetical protein